MSNRLKNISNIVGCAYWFTLGLFVSILIYDNLIVSSEIGCGFYNGTFNKFIGNMIAPITALLFIILFLARCSQKISAKKWKELLITIAVFAATALLFIFTLANTLYYCAFEGLGNELLRLFMAR